MMYDETKTDEVALAAAQRGSRDVVLSGPVGQGWGPGKWFKSRFFAFRYAVMKYGASRVKLLPGVTSGRWAFLIKDLKKE